MNKFQAATLDPRPGADRCPFRDQDSPAADSKTFKLKPCGGQCGFPHSKWCALSSAVSAEDGLIHTPCDNWVIPLTVKDFSRRMEAVINAGLPCVVTTVHAVMERWHQGMIRRMRRGEGRLELLGDSFAIYLRESNIKAILLVNYARMEEGSPSIELFNRGDHLVARIHSFPEPEISAKWRDIMCFPEAGSVSGEPGRISD